MFRQISELTVLGMHPAIPYPRRSQIRPLVGSVAPLLYAVGGKELEATVGSQE